MRSPIFDEGIPPAGFEGFHFKIRGWRDNKNAEHFNEFIRKIARDTQLVTARLVTHETGGAFIKLERASKGKPDLLGRVRRLCWEVVDPDNRAHVNRLTDRSLLGFIPLTVEVQSYWNDALFKTALKEGPMYFRNVYEEERGGVRLDFIPSWAAVLAFAMVSEINIAGYRDSTTTAASPTAKCTTATSKSGFDGSASDMAHVEVASFFDEKGMEIGGEVLQLVVDEMQEGHDRRSVHRVYSDGVKDLEDAIQVMFESFGELIDSERDKFRLSQCCKQAKSACYSAALRATRATLANKTVFQEFLKFRHEQSTSPDLSVEIGALGLLSTAAVSSSFVHAPVTVSALWTAATTFSWPTILAVTNPVAGAVVGLATLAMVIASRTDATRAKDILHHQRLIILISRCCTVTNALVVLMTCIDYLEKPSHDRTAPTFIQNIHDEELLKSWNEFVTTKEREREERPPSQRKTRDCHQHHAKSGLNKKQRQVRRFMKWLADDERKRLGKSLERLKDHDKLDDWSNSESEGDSTE